MTDQPTEQIKIERIASWLFVISILVVSLVYFSDFLQPIILAIMVWYFIYVLKEYARKVRFGKRKLPEWLLTPIAFILIILITFGIVEIVTHNLELIINGFPVYVARSRHLFESVKTIEGFEKIQEGIITRLEDFDFKPLVTGLLNGLSGFAGNIFMIIIYVGFLLAEERLFNKKLTILTKDAEEPGKFSAVLQEVNESVRTYVLVKTQMSLLTGFLSYFILLLFGVDFPVLWGFLIFLLNFIPYVGSLVATFLPAAFAILQFQSFSIFVWVFLSIQIVQVLVGNIIEPRVMGRTLNLSPLGVLFALTFWGVLWGILGMILSVPITSILVIIASRIPNLRFIAVWFSETGELNNH